MAISECHCVAPLAVSMNGPFGNWRKWSLGLLLLLFLLLLLLFLLLVMLLNTPLPWMILEVDTPLPLTTQKADTTVPCLSDDYRHPNLPKAQNRLLCFDEWVPIALEKESLRVA